MKTIHHCALTLCVMGLISLLSAGSAFADAYYPPNHPSVSSWGPSWQCEVNGTQGTLVEGANGGELCQISSHAILVDPAGSSLEEIISVAGVELIDARVLESGQIILVLPEEHVAQASHNLWFLNQIIQDDIMMRFTIKDDLIMGFTIKDDLIMG